MSKNHVSHDDPSIQRNRTVGESHGTLLLQDCFRALGYFLSSGFGAMSSVFHCVSQILTFALDILFTRKLPC